MRLLTTRYHFLQFILGLGIICGNIACAGHVSAAPSQASFNPNASSGLEISPALIELNGERGKTYVLKLQVHNVTNSDLVYSPMVVDFAAKDETGAPRFLDQGALPPTASMVDWMQSLTQLSLKSQETRKIDIVVTVPADAEPGGHYGVVRFEGRDPQAVNNSIVVKASTGLLVLARISGTTNEKMTLASLEAEQNGKQSSFFEKSPITFVTRLKNEGNVHLKPGGTLEIRDMFGSLVSLQKVNETMANVLPHSIRRFESEMNKDWMIGRYATTLTVGYGTTGQVVTSQITFWVVPYRLLAGALFVIITIMFIVWRLVKVYNRHIISKYKKQKNDH